MPTNSTQEFFTLTRLKTVHINPSVMEGTYLRHAMLGPGGAIVLVRYAPVWLNPPVITGDFRIPSVLVCGEGQNDAAPRAVLTYQWQVDGVDIPGETTNTLTTILDFDTFELTCDVTATNTEGFAVATSNGITAEIVEPIINQQFTFNSITGLNQYSQINLMRSDVMITQGLAMDDRMDMETQSALIGTGMWVEDRVDAQSSYVSVLTGLDQEDGQGSNDLDAYVVWQPTRETKLAIINPGAETGDMTGWTSTLGTAHASDSTANGASIIGRHGDWYFGADDAVEVNMEQVVVLDTGLNAATDAGNCLAQLNAYFDSYAGNDTVQVSIFFLDGSDVDLGSVVSLGPYANPQNRNWKTKHSDLQHLPALTRKIKIVVYFRRYQTLAGNNGYVDEISVDLFTDE